MKKKVILSALTLLMAGQAASEDASHDFRLVHEISYQCSIAVSNNNIDNVNLPMDKPNTADITFTCNDLSGIEVILASLGGGLTKEEDPTNPIHFVARLGGMSYLSPDVVALNTQTHGTNPVSGTFVTEQQTIAARGLLEVRLLRPQNFIPTAGKYTDTLRVTLRSPLSTKAG